MLIRKEFEQIQKTTGFNLELLEKAYHLTRDKGIKRNAKTSDIKRKSNTQRWDSIKLHISKYSTTLNRSRF